MIQKTDQSQIKFEITPELNFTDNYANIGTHPSTSGSDVDLSINGNFQRKPNQKLTKNARNSIHVSLNPFQNLYKNKILDTIDKYFEDIANDKISEIDVSYDNDDETLNLQWNIRNSTLIVVIGPTPGSSFWVFLSGKEDRVMRAKGDLDKFLLLIPGLIDITERTSTEN